MKEKYYQFTLDDYSVPSYTSWTKQYYSTESDCKKLLEEIKDDERYDIIRQSFTEFLSGNKKCKHYAGFIEVQLAKSGKVIKEREFSAENIEFRYKNTYGFYYDIKADKAKFFVKAFAGRSKKIAVIYYAIINNAKFKSIIPKDKWSPLDGMIWGHPGIIKVNKQNGIYVLSNTLAVLDSVHDAPEDAEKYIDEMQLPDLQSFFEDVFGDG